MFRVVLEKKMLQPLVAANNSCDELATKKFAKTSGATLSLLIFRIVFEKRIFQPLVATVNASDHFVTDRFCQI